MLKITNHQENTNHYHNELSLHTHLDGHYLKKKMKNTEIANIGKDLEKLEHLFSAFRNVKWYSHFGKQYGSSSRNKKYNYHMGLLLGFTQKELKSESDRYFYSSYSL